MRKIIKATALFMAASTLLVACNTGSQTTSSKPSSKYVNVGLPKAIQVTTPNFFDEGNRDTYDYRMEWLDTLSEKYGVHINISSPPIDTYSDNISQAINQHESGIMDVILKDTVIYLKDKGIILPLDDYLANNRVWNSLPREMREMYAFDGHIWAVPNAYEIVQYVRAIRKDWLDNLGLEEPKTVEDLYKVLVAFKHNDPDGDGDPTNTIPLSGDQGMAWAKDILAAFGLSISESGLLPYAYNPEEGCFEDAMLKPQAQSALQFLKKMYQEGLIDPDIFSNQSSDYEYNKSKGVVGTYMTTVGEAKYYDSMDLIETLNPDKFYDPNQPEDFRELTSAYTEIAALTGDKTENLMPVYYYGTPYVLLANTEQPAETINFFVDLLFSSESNYLQALIGLDATYTRTSDNVIKMKYTDEANNEYYPLANLVGYIDGKYKRTDFTIVKSQSEQAIANKKEINQYLSAFPENSLKQKKTYVLESRYTSPRSSTLTENMNDILIAFKDCFTDAITDDNTTVEKALAAYRKYMRENGYQTILEEANAAIGAKSNQKY